MEKSTADPGSAPFGLKTGIRKRHGSGFAVFLPLVRVKDRGVKEKTPDRFGFRDGFAIGFMGAPGAVEPGKAFPDCIIKAGSVKGTKDISHPGSSMITPADGGPKRLDLSAVLGSGIQPPFLQEHQGF